MEKRTIRPTPTPIAFKHLEGHCYILPLPDLVHASDGPFRSQSAFSLWEDDKVIGDQTPFVMDIVSKGRARTSTSVMSCFSRQATTAIQMKMVGYTN